MNRKWVGIAAAVALAVVGTWVIVNYVRGAEDRALEGQETIAVLVVDSVIPAGTPAEDIASSVHVEFIPTKVQVRGSLADANALQSLEGLVASVDLLPGEQLIADRFVTTEALDDQDRIEVADGLVEVSVSLSPERAIGGELRPGDVVAVFASFDPETAGVQQGVAGEQEADLPSTTHIILEGVVVTNVQVEELPQANTSEDSNVSTLGLSPTGNLLVTLALEPSNAERLVFTAEFGTIWLADASLASADADTNIQDRTTVYDDPASGR